MTHPLEEGLRRVWPVPDTEPLEMDKPRCVYASWPWLTKEFMEEVGQG